MLAVPHLRQLRAWSCGPACVNMLLRYYGVTESEAYLVDALQANERDGTAPEAIRRFLVGRGFRTSRRGTLADLANAIKRGRPVIVDYQDHGPRGVNYADAWDHGHYAVCVGVSETHVMLCDPSSKRPRRHLKTADFLARWHDIGFGLKPKFYVQWGLSVGPKK